MKQNIKKIKFLLLAIIVAVGVNYVSAWVGPSSSAPGNNVDGLIDVTVVEQSKGGAGSFPGSLLDIDDATNINETFSTTNLAIWDTVRVISGDTYVNSLEGPNYVCAESTGKIVICP